MRDQLLEYYERELTFLRQMGAEFAAKYPKVAARLSLESDKCEDAHVERLLEGVAFLAGRIRLKIDDEFPELTESLLNVLYPHYLAPIPSMSIVEFKLDPDQGKLTTGYSLEKGTVLYSRPVQGTPCRFRTCYHTTLWPLEVTEASLQSPAPVDSKGLWAEASIKLKMHCLNNSRLAELKQGEGKETHVIDKLRFYLNGEAQLVYSLYEMIFNNAVSIELRANTGKNSAVNSSVIRLSTKNLKMVGFELDEGMLLYPSHSFAGYRLLSEYFAFPDKYLFFDITGIDEAARAGFGDQFEIIINLRNILPPRIPIDTNTFRLGCTPIVNIFDKIAEPIQLNHQQSEYRVIADLHRQMATEVYSVNQVTTTDPYLHQSQHFQPFYSLRHSYDHDDQVFWYATRRPSEIKDDLGTEVYLSLTDLNFNPRIPAVETLTLRVSCTNRDLPSKLPFGGREGNLEIEGATPIAHARCLKKPTNTLRPPMRRGTQWHLISHLTLNYLSIVGSETNDSPEALREILQLYDFMDSLATRKQIAGIEKINARRVVRQTGSRIGTGFVRGIETTIELDEDQFIGSGVFLFSAVLECFLGLYVSINSFNQLVVKTKQREGELKRWLPRTGQQILL